MTDRGFWLGRWERGEIGWHQAEVEPKLIRYFSELEPTRIFVPLCGKSRDLAWLASRGHEVIGVELSEKAIREFFQENRIDWRESPSGACRRYEGGGITVWQGDFFALRPLDLPDVGAVYDRAALVALPRKMRSAYARHLTALLGDAPAKPSFRFLQLLFERTPADEKGPPFSVSRAELVALYGERFEVSLLDRNVVADDPVLPRKVEECAYFLRQR